MSGVGARFPIPPTATHPDILLYNDRRPDAAPRLVVPEKVCLKRCNAVISPSLDAIAVAIEGMVSAANIGFSNLAYARVGDDSWTALVPPFTWLHWSTASDFIFHKGRLYVLYTYGYLLAFDLQNPAAPPLVSPAIGRIACDSLLTETPDGEDLLLLWRGSACMEVFRLDKDALEWNRVESIGDVALFADERGLSSLSTKGFPCLRSNCVYFTYGANWSYDNINHILVYNLEDGSVSPGDDIGESYWPRPIWFTPTL